MVKKLNRNILIILIFLSVIFYTLILFIIHHNVGSFVIRLVATDIYVPIYYWLVIAGYAFIYSLGNKIKFSTLIPSALALGFFLHIYIMLLALNQTLLFKEDYPKMYLYYAFAAETMLMVTSGYFLNWIKLPERLLPERVFLSFPLILNTFYHLYRDIKYISVVYFCFHLLALAVVYILLKKVFSTGMLKKDMLVNFLKNEKVILIFIFLLSFLTRCVFAFHIIHLTGSQFPTASDDGPTYHANALLIMQNASVISSGNKILPNAFDPGYSFFLGLIYRIFGPSFYSAAFIQALLNALMVVTVYLIVKLTFNGKLGVIAAILTAINQPLIMLSVVLTTEATYIPLLVFSIYYLIKYQRRANTGKEKGYLYTGGMLMSLAIITRAVILIFPAVVIFWLLFLRNKPGHLNAIKKFLIGLSVFLILITALTYHNTGKLTFFTNKHNMTWADFTEKDDPRRYYSNAKLIAMGINPYKDLKGSLQAIVKSPIRFLKAESDILPERLKLFLFFPNYGNFDPIFILNSTTPNQYASTMEFYALLVLLAGLIHVLIRKDMLDKTSLIILIILYYLFIHVVVNTGQCGRYRVPLHPFFIIFAANGIYLFYKNIIQKSLESIAKEC